MRNDIIGIIDGVFTIIFAFEAVIKIISSGLIFQRYAYLKDFLNAMDLVIVVGG